MKIDPHYKRLLSGIALCTCCAIAFSQAGTGELRAELEKQTSPRAKADICFDLSDRYFNINASQASLVTIRLFDNKGALVYTRQNALLKGNNGFDINISHLVSGVYSVAVEWNQGKIQQSIKLVKQ